MNVIGVEEQEEKLSTHTHEEFPALHIKTFLAVTGDNLNGSYIHDRIDVPQHQYYGVHTVGPEFDDDMFMTIGKNWDEEDNDELCNNIKNE